MSEINGIDVSAQADFKDASVKVSWFAAGLLHNMKV